MTASWTTLNAGLDRVKKNPILRALYRLPWIPSTYHYLLAFAGAVIYGFPSRQLKVIGVTGTKGKTTTLELINAGLEAAGRKTALLSSVRIKLDRTSEPNLSGNTQPGRFFAQYFMREAVKLGCEYALLEVGSEGVVRHRHRFIYFDAAVFINIHPEHIESHGSFEKYREAKLNFFRYVRKSPKKNKRFFINQEDKNADYFVEAAGQEEVVLTAKTSVPLQMRGEFNRDNAGVAEAILRSFGIREATIEEALSGFTGVPGRMEYVQKEPFAVVVDYAHTPDSLEAVYKSLKPQNGKLICVLGSAGGGRDRWKRPKMGAIAAQYCAQIILTDEDPFDEDPAEIIEEIQMGIAKETTDKLDIVIDRRQAIKRGIEMASQRDVVIITGKGSEPYLRVAGNEKIPWSDVGVAKEVLNYTRKI